MISFTKWGPILQTIAHYLFHVSAALNRYIRGEQWLYLSHQTNNLSNLHLTPASSMCPQLCVPSALAGQSMSLVSVPRHWTLSSQIWPTPLVNPVNTATAPAVWSDMLGHVSCSAISSIRLEIKHAITHWQWLTLLHPLTTVLPVSIN